MVADGGPGVPDGVPQTCEGGEDGVAGGGGVRGEEMAALRGPGCEWDGVAAVGLPGDCEAVYVASAVKGGGWRFGEVTRRRDSIGRRRPGWSRDARGSWWWWWWCQGKDRCLARDRGLDRRPCACIGRFAWPGAEDETDTWAENQLWLSNLHTDSGDYEPKTIDQYALQQLEAALPAGHELQRKDFAKLVIV